MWYGLEDFILPRQSNAEQPQTSRRILLESRRMVVCRRGSIPRYGMALRMVSEHALP